MTEKPLALKQRRAGTPPCWGSRLGPAPREPLWVEAAPEPAPLAVLLPKGENCSLAAVYFFILTIVILSAVYMQRAWPRRAFLVEPLAEPKAPSRWW